MFDKYDVDNNGVIDRTEWIQAFDEISKRRVSTGSVPTGAVSAADILELHDEALSPGAPLKEASARTVTLAALLHGEGRTVLSMEVSVPLMDLILTQTRILNL